MRINPITNNLSAKAATLPNEKKQRHTTDRLRQIGRWMQAHPTRINEKTESTSTIYEKLGCEKAREEYCTNHATAQELCKNEFFAQTDWYTIYDDANADAYMQKIADQKTTEGNNGIQHNMRPRAR